MKLLLLISMVIVWGGVTYGKRVCCPLDCPPGWNRWGPIGPTSKHCYLMPPQPIKRMNFTDCENYCHDAQQTSYVLVVNDPIEQAAGSAIVQQYFFNYFADLTDIFVWFGAKKKSGKWVYDDGSSGWFSLNLVDMVLNTAPEGSCLSAEPKALGAWVSRECSASSGACLCEMDPVPVCGASGGFIPIGTLGGKGSGGIGPGGILPGVSGLGLPGGLGKK